MCRPKRFLLMYSAEEEVTMANEKKTTPTENTGKRSTSGKASTSRRVRKHGYQGYPLTKSAGGVHFGRGMSGVEPLGGGNATLPRADIFTEDSTRGAEKESEEEDPKP
jgi:hypothetical protein